MSYFILGPIVVNEPDWIIDQISRLTTEEVETAVSYQKLIEKGFFPPQRISDEWANGEPKPFHYFQARAFSYRKN